DGDVRIAQGDEQILLVLISGVERDGIFQIVSGYRIENLRVRTVGIRARIEGAQQPQAGLRHRIPKQGQRIDDDVEPLVRAQEAVRRDRKRLLLARSRALWLARQGRDGKRQVQRLQSVPV